MGDQMRRVVLWREVRNRVLGRVEQGADLVSHPGP